MRSMWKKKWFENGCRTFAFKYIYDINLPRMNLKKIKSLGQYLADGLHGQGLSDLTLWDLLIALGQLYNQSTVSTEYS